MQVGNLETGEKLCVPDWTNRMGDLRNDELVGYRRKLPTTLNTSKLMLRRTWLQLTVRAIDIFFTKASYYVAVVRRLTLRCYKSRLDDSYD